MELGLNERSAQIKGGNSLLKGQVTAFPSEVIKAAFIEAVVKHCCSILVLRVFFSFPHHFAVPPTRAVKDLLEERTVCVAEFPMWLQHIWFKHFIFILSPFYAGFMLIIPRGY